MGREPHAWMQVADSGTRLIGAAGGWKKYGIWHPVADPKQMRWVPLTFWMVLCGSKTQWFLWVPSNSGYSMILSLQRQRVEGASGCRVHIHTALSLSFESMKNKKLIQFSPAQIICRSCMSNSSTSHLQCKTKLNRCFAFQGFNL